MKGRGNERRRRRRRWNREWWGRRVEGREGGEKRKEGRVRREGRRQWNGFYNERKQQSKHLSGEREGWRQIKAPFGSYCTHTHTHAHRLVHRLLGAAWNNKKPNNVVSIMRNNSWSTDGRQRSGGQTEAAGRTDLFPGPNKLVCASRKSLCDTQWENRGGWGV